jgi:hypothetical protein
VLKRLREVESELWAIDRYTLQRSWEPGGHWNIARKSIFVVMIVPGSMVQYKTTAMRRGDHIGSSFNPFLVLPLLMSTIIIYQKGNKGNGHRKSEVFMVQITSEIYFPLADKRVRFTSLVRVTIALNHVYTQWKIEPALNESYGDVRRVLTPGKQTVHTVI